MTHKKKMAQVFLKLPNRLPTFQRVLFMQSFPVLLAGGTGLLLAGIALEFIETWNVFHRRPLLMVLLPMLLGLKCNLEMTLASRLSTAYHMGLFSNAFFSSSNRVLLANIGVVQLQALVVSVLASIITVFYGALWENIAVTATEWMVVLSTSLLTAWFTAMILAVFTAGVMYISAKRSLNPDNISGPLVASLGDLLAIMIMGAFAVISDNCSPSFLLVVVIVVIVTVVIIASQTVSMHQPTTQVLYNGWQPLLSALAISSLAGFLLESGLDNLTGGISALLPLINGIGGNIAGIFASRTASSLHKREAKDTSGNVELTLLTLSVPAHLVFLFAARLFGHRERIFKLSFILLFLTASFLQVFVLLIVGDVLAQRAWQSGLDPDDHVIPYLTASGDALGTLALVVISKIIS